MKRVAETEHNPILEIPRVVWIRPFIVETERAIVVAFGIEHVRVAVPVRYV